MSFTVLYSPAKPIFAQFWFSKINFLLITFLFKRQYAMYQIHRVIKIFWFQYFVETFYQIETLFLHVVYYIFQKHFILMQKLDGSFIF